ncbi:MAG: hypothetical protein KDD81_15120, partial [Rhodobacteraceae bacterium]|nr:hypothetical protein [Paracoccaceae bacterium]
AGLERGNLDDAIAVLGAFSRAEMLASLTLVQDLVRGLSAEASVLATAGAAGSPRTFTQIW